MVASQSGRRSIWPLFAVALASLALLSPLIVHHAKAAEVDASIDVFFAGDQRSRGSFEKLESMMTERVACMVLARYDDIFSDEGAQFIHELGETLIALEGVPVVFSLTRAQRPVRGSGFSLDIQKLIQFESFVPLESQTDEEWERIEALVTSYPWARDLLVSRDGKWTMLVVEVARTLETHEQKAQLWDDVEAAVGPFREQAEALYVGSFPFIEVEMRDDIQKDVRRFLFVLPVLLAAILLVAFRSFGVLACVLVFEAMGVGLVPVVFGWNGESINLYTGIVFPLVAGLQLTFLTHFFAALRWAQRKDPTFAVALPLALERVLRPSAIAALTTVMGLASLVTCDVGLVREFGLLGAQSVLCAFVVTFGPTWLLSKWMKRHVEPQALQFADEMSGTTNSHVASLVDALARFRLPILVSVAALMFATLPGMSGVRTDLRAIEFLSPKSTSRQALGAVDRQMGGMNLFELEVDFGEPGGIQEPKALEFLERLEVYAAGVPGVTNVYGYAQVYAVLNEIWKREAPGSRTVPKEPALIAAMGMVVHSQEFLFEDSIYDADRQKTTLFIRTRDMPAESYLEILDDIAAYADRERPDNVTVGGRAGLHSVLAADRKIVASQVRSLAVCIAAVLTTLLVLWRSVRLATVAILVNLPPLAAVLALHGYAGVPLNSVTVMVGAMVLGIAVDNGVHVLSFWSEERSRVRGERERLSWVMSHKLAPMACTTAVLVSGFSLFLLSRFPPLADFGRLSILALIVALASTALVLPPLLMTVFAQRREQQPAVETASSSPLQ